MTRERLEGLPMAALRELSRKENLDVDPDGEREDLIFAILEAYDEDQREREKLKNLIIKIEESKFSLLADDPFPALGESPIPVLLDRYDEDSVRLILRDPTWALAIWEVRKVVEETWAKEGNFRGYSLKVLERTSPEGVPVSTFFLPLLQGVGTRYLNLPNSGRFYQVELLAQFDREGRLLATSSMVAAPSVEPPYQKVLEAAPEKRRFLELSGLTLSEPYQENVEIPNTTEAEIPQRIGGWDDSSFEESR